MRKLTRRMYKWIISTLVITLLLSTMPLSEIRADANTHGEYDCAPLAVVYNQTSTWGNNTQCEITVTNISDMKVEGWRLEFVFGSSVTINSIWNAQNLSNEDTPANSVDIGSEAYNANIEPSGSVSFGFIVSGLESAPVAPSEVCLVADDVVGDNPEAEITPTPIPEDTGMFPYAIFAGSMVTDLRFSAWKSDITGDIYSGKNFVYQGSELYVNGYARTVGTVQPAGWTTAMSGADENIAPLEMPDWGDKILAKADLMTTMEDDVFTSQNDIIADGFYYTEGSLSISSATFSGDVVIVANGDITLNVDTIINNGRILLYSETGNITVNGTQVELSGVVYAPNGRITLNAYDMTINGRVVADEFSYSGSILKIIADEADLQLFEELPEVTINASAQQVSVGDSAYFHITLPEETPYEINFRLNGEAVNINFSENETSGYYYLNTDQMGEYVFGAYVTLPYGEFSLGSSTILVSEVVTPTQEPTPTVTPTPVVTDIPEPTVTVTPTPIPVDEELPEISITASTEEVVLGGNAYFNIMVSAETEHEIKYRLNEEDISVVFSENEAYAQYYLDTQAAGEYVFEAFLNLTNGEVVLASSKITVVNAIQDHTFECWTSKSYYDISPDNIDVYFYADVKNQDCESVELWRDDVFVSDLRDDGHYSFNIMDMMNNNISGDDIAGDGVYTGIISIDRSVTGEQVFDFVVTYSDGTKQNIESVIRIDDSAQALVTMDTITFQVYKYKNSKAYSSDDVSVRVEKIANILNELVETGHVQPDGVYVSEDTALVSCYTIDGDLLDFECADDDTHNSYESYSYLSSDNVASFDNSALYTSAGGGDVLYMVAFDNRDAIYEEEKAYLSSVGIEATLDFSPTYFDYMNCLTSGYDIVIFSAHGIYNKTQEECRISSGIILDRRDDEARSYFNEQSRLGNISYIPRGNENLYFEISLREGFFQNNYLAYPNNNTIVLVEACEFAGGDGYINYDFGNTLISLGIPYCTGFVNSVEANYSRLFVREFIENMYLGYTTESSLKNALNIVGASDEVNYDNDGINAYPIGFGNRSHTLVTNTIANASFEYSGIVDQYVSQHAQHIYGWTSAGSSNTFNSLSSEIMPTNGNQMAMLSTGIGSSESIYFASKEGSSLSQVFSVSPDVSVLRFDYNLVSEEPMEFVGSKYDDCFEVRLVDKDTGETHTILKTSINTATWNPISVINFDGGDDTAYQTGWLTWDYDISGFKGKEVELVFIVYDKGDSLFDTAVMIDNIRLS